ncbi:hypothetical protein PFLuk1_02624 [Pseudomonas fluorescens]|nr:hypothetical protein PFLuk1_02624 [Pseudomonas fluorescens]
MRLSGPTNGNVIPGLGTPGQRLQQPQVQRMNQVVISLTGRRGKARLIHLHKPAWCRIISITPSCQPRQTLPTLILAPNLRQRGSDLLSHTIRTSTGAQDNAGAWSTTRRTATPFHDRGHGTSHPTAFAITAALLSPVPQQCLHFFDHRPAPTLKTQPDTKNAIPNTNPTQKKSFKFNSLICFVLGVLGVLGLTGLA